MSPSPRTKGISASPRLARILADLREDPSSRQELEERVNNERRGAAKRQAPLTAQEQLLVELHRQAAAEELPAREAPAPAPALVPEWGADDDPPDAPAAEAQPPLAPRARPSPRPRPAPPLPNTPWAAELVARARGHYTTEPEEFAAGGRGRANVRGRQKGLELHGQFRCHGSQTQTERITASVTAASGPHEPYQPRELAACSHVERPGAGAARWMGGNLDLGPHAQKSAFGDAALLQGYSSPFVDAAQREAAALRQRNRDREMAPKLLSARAARAKPLLSPRRPLKAAGRPAVLPSLDDAVDGLDEREMVTARLMLAGGLRR